MHGYDIGDAQPDEGEEEMQLGIFSIDELWRKIRENELPDAKTQIAVLWALSARD